VKTTSRVQERKKEEKKGLSSLKWIDFESGGETRKR
jgi:hypothetical protein